MKLAVEEQLTIVASCKSQLITHAYIELNEIYENTSKIKRAMLDRINQSGFSVISFVTKYLSVPFVNQTVQHL